MVSIKQMQNSEELLEVQYSARVLYNMAEWFSLFTWMLAGGWTVFDACIATRIEVATDSMLIINLVISILIILLQFSVKKCTEYAAGLRMFFDFQLFGWEKDEYQGNSKQCLKEMVYKIITFRKRDSMIRMKNTGVQKPRGVKDWYTSVSDKDSRSESIRKCQDENMWWTMEIAKTQRIFMSVISACVIILAFIYFWDESLGGVVIRMLPLTPLVIDLTVEISRSYKQRRIFEEYQGKKKMTNSNKEVDELALNTLQKSIDDRRLIPVIAINKIHDVFSNRFHESYNKSNT